MVAGTWAPPNLCQPEHGYHFTIDSWLLVGFAAAFRPHFFCDLGTGCGPIAFGLASQLKHGRGVAIERSPELAGYARQNLARLPVTVIQGDLRFFPWKDGIFDLVACNPPYFETGSGRGRADAKQAVARHTLYGDMDTFASELRWSLADGGRLCFIYPADRASGILSRLAASGWFLCERLDILSFADRPPKLVCLALSSNPCPSPRADTLVLYKEHRHYTEQAIAFLRFATN